MRFASCFFAILLSWLPAQGASAAQQRRVVVIVWDAMRPDFISEQNCPTLVQLARRGVTFRNHHSVYLSATEVNGTAIFTGCYPAHDGIMGNVEYRPAIDPVKPIHTENVQSARKGDSLTHDRYLRSPTMAEIVRRAGRTTVVVGAKAVAFLADRAVRTSPDVGVNVFAGSTLPPNLLNQLTNRYGAFPPYLSLDPTRIDWTTSALIDPLWAEAVPSFSLVWMNEPDLTQHETGPGSERSLAAIRNADKNLARILATLEARGLRDSTDVFVVSDHGASTISARLDVADLLTKAGLKAVREFKGEPSAGSILAVSDGGSTFIYVIGHAGQVIRQVVKFLQRAEFSGVIFTRKQVPGTFALQDVRLDSDFAPDVVVAMRWNSDKNQNGTAGMVQSDESTYGPGQGSHVTLSPFDMHATLVAAGPDFREGVVDTLASGNVDVAPTVLWILGLKPPSPMDGRVLAEALTIKGPQIRSFQPGHLEAKSEVEGVGWSQYLNFTEVNGVRYLDEGNGAQAPARLAK